ncbi:MAG: RloB family protein [Methylococcaceae bacterium]|nr:RloB family protein [Methylococcaceae bacterium]
MGSEDLFHKRKAKKQQDSVRRNASREPYDHVLIVCEGEKTEPFYFDEMRVFLDLDSANIQIDGRCDSSPKSVVEYAQDLFTKEKNRAGNYDRVFCVFDRDQHETFDYALEKINSINAELKKEKELKEDVFTAIQSIPAFEYWFLLHFTPSTKPYSPLATKSVGDQVIDDLKTYLPDYKKKQKGIYKYSIENSLLSGAKAHSKRIFELSKKTRDINPSTNVHELVEYLEELNKKDDSELAQIIKERAHEKQEAIEVNLDDL